MRQHLGDKCLALAHNANLRHVDVKRGRQLVVTRAQHTHEHRELTRGRILPILGNGLLGLTGCPWTEEAIPSTQSGPLQSGFTVGSPVPGAKKGKAISCLLCLVSLLETQSACHVIPPGNHILKMETAPVYQCIS